jgi:hypothetical protein
MKTKMNAVVGELVRNFDFEICQDVPRFKSVPGANRKHLLLEMLTHRDVVTFERVDNCWRPSKRIGSYLGVNDHGLADDYDEVIATVSLENAALANEYAEHLNSISDAVIEKDVGLLVSLFTMHKQGLIEFDGRGADGLCRWKPVSDFDSKVSDIGQAMVKLDPVVAGYVELLYRSIFEGSEPLMEVSDRNGNSKDKAYNDLVCYLLAANLAEPREGTSPDLQEICATEKLRRKSEWLLQGRAPQDKRTRKHIELLIRNALRFLHRHRCSKLVLIVNET